MADHPDVEVGGARPGSPGRPLPAVPRAPPQGPARSTAAFLGVRPDPPHRADQGITRRVPGTRWCARRAGCGHVAAPSHGAPPYLPPIGGQKPADATSATARSDSRTAGTTVTVRPVTSASRSVRWLAA